MMSQAENKNTPHQIWVDVHIDEPRLNALYLHTFYAGRQDFPYDFPGVMWDVEYPRVLAPYIDDTMQVGLYPDTEYYIIRPKIL